MSFEYIYWVLGGNLWNLWVFSLKTFIWKKWVIFLPWEFDFAIHCVIFQDVSFKFWSKNAGIEDFCLSFELFSWVTDFLSFGVLEFFSGVHEKKPGSHSCSNSKVSRFHEEIVFYASGVELIRFWPVVWGFHIHRP